MIKNGGVKSVQASQDYKAFREGAYNFLQVCFCFVLPFQLMKNQGSDQNPEMSQRLEFRV